MEQVEHKVATRVWGNIPPLPSAFIAAIVVGTPHPCDKKSWRAGGMDANQDNHNDVTSAFGCGGKCHEMGYLIAHQLQSVD